MGKLLKIALFGYGKMGRCVEECALKLGHEVVVKIDSRDRCFDKIKFADVCIDFSVSHSLYDNIEIACKFSKPIVIGTTGLDFNTDRFPECNIGVLYSPNFSVGMALFSLLAKKADKLFGKFYDVSGIEIHHKQKKDTPSGTAMHLSRQISNIKFDSIRSGSNVGIHKIIFDSKEDSVELIHKAKSRLGFAMGAISAANWLIGKVGFYTFEDYVMEKLLCTEFIQR